MSNIDQAEMARHLTALHCGRPFELRAISGRQVFVGYFTDPEQAAAIADGLQRVSGLYTVLNEIDPRLLARSAGMFSVGGSSTGDKDIRRRLWLPVDIDYARPSGISSSEDEVTACRQLGDRLALSLCEAGWPEPLRSDSGNGAHLVYPIDLPNDESTRQVVQACLAGLSTRYSVPGGATIDTGVFNAARIWKVAGTWARKGSDTPSRPHRIAALVAVPGRLGKVTTEQMLACAHEAAKLPVRQGSAYDSLDAKCYANLDKWVPLIFPSAVKTDDGYRIPDSEFPGRGRKQDIKVGATYVTDYSEHSEGTPNHYGPVKLVAQYRHKFDLLAAASQLAGILGTSANPFADAPAAPLGYVPAPDPFDFARLRSASDLMSKQFRALVYAFDDFLPQGSFLLTSRPKMKKTFLALQACIAVATGGKLLGHQAQKGTALLLGLEDTERRIQSRISDLYEYRTMPDLAKFHYLTMDSSSVAFPRGTDGCNVLRQFVSVHPDTRLIVIDTFAHFKAAETGRAKQLYLEDYESMMPITKLANELNITILIVHHDRKGSISKQSDDWIEDVSGTTGLTGSVDGIMGIKGKRGGETNNLVLTGRDVKYDHKIPMTFRAEAGGWYVAEAPDLKSSIKALLVQYPVLSIRELESLLLTTPEPEIKKALLDLRRDNIVDSVRGGYALASTTATGDSF